MQLPLALVLTLLFATASGALTPTATDTALIEGGYSQNGFSLNQRAMERMLLATHSMAVIDHVERARGCRIASRAIGISMWCVTTGVSAYEVYRAIDDFQHGQDVSPFALNVTLPLMIGGEVTSFIQGLLYRRAGYLQYKAVQAYNNQLSAERKLTRVVDHELRQTQFTQYTQDGLLLAPTTVQYVLLEESASRATAARAALYRETSGHTASVGASLLVLAIMATVEDRDAGVYWGLGGGLVGFGIVNAISATAARNRAIRKYNESVRGPLLRGAASADATAERATRLSRTKGFAYAYWLYEGDPATSTYVDLLLSRLPIASLAGVPPDASVPIARADALIVATYRKDSLWWNADRVLFRRPAVGPVDQAGGTVVLNGKACQWESASTESVSNLLASPAGTLPVNRLLPPEFMADSIAAVRAEVEKALGRSAK
jgi:hypothetical protein